MDHSDKRLSRDEISVSFGHFPPPAVEPQGAMSKISGFSTVEEFLESRLSDKIHESATAAIAQGSRIVFDLQWLLSPDIRDVVDYFSLDQLFIQVLNSVVERRILVRWGPDYLKRFLPVIYVNGVKVDKPSSENVGQVISINGLPKDITTSIVADEVVYICQNCHTEVNGKARQPPPRCPRPACRGSKSMIVKDVVNEYEEASFTLKFKEGVLFCRSRAERLCLLAHGLQNEVTGLLHRELKKDRRIEYWLEVLGVRPAYSIPYEQDAGKEIQSLEDLRSCFPHVVGEDEIIVLSSLSIVSRLNLDRSRWIMGVVVQGQSSGGKSYLMNAILAPWVALGRVKNLSRFTGAYLERLALALKREDVDNLIIAVPELFANTPQQLHVLLSEGKLILGVVDKETGTPQEYEIEGQPFLFATTTAVEFTEDLENRVVMVKIDEGEAQTRRVLEYWSALVEGNGDVALEIQAKQVQGMVRLINHLRRLKPMFVVVPYARDLLSLFHGVELAVTMRRDFQKMLNIIMASALFFQNSRPKTSLQTSHGSYPVVVATVDDYRNLIKLFKQMNVTLTRLTPVEKLIIETLMAASDSENDKEMTRRDIARRIAENGVYYSENYILKVLNKLVNLGYVGVNEERRPYKYYYLKAPREVDLEELIPVVEQRVAEFASKAGGMVSG